MKLRTSVRRRKTKKMRKWKTQKMEEKMGAHTPKITCLRQRSPNQTQFLQVKAILSCQSDP